MELVQPLEQLVEESPHAPALLPSPARDDSPLARARLQRQLTRDVAAARAGISEEEATWLEEGRVYRFPSPDDAQVAESNAAVLPPPWRVPVTVLNGSGDINFTRVVASHVQSFGYTIKHVGRADRFTYLQTSVYFPPRCEAVATRLAKQLGVPAKPLPGGSGQCKLWVIAGPARGPG